MERPTDDSLDDPRVRRRVDVLTHVRDGTIDLEQATTALGPSSRQVRRLLTAWLEHGPSGLVHGNRGREPVNRTDAELLDPVMSSQAGASCSGRCPTSGLHSWQ